MPQKTSKDTTSLPPKEKKVDFNKVDVYLFDIKEGIDAVPTTGGIPLGMETKHHDKKEYSCNQFEKLHAAKSSQHYADDSASTPGTSTNSLSLNFREHLYEPLSHEARKALFFDKNLPFDQEAIQDSLNIVESREVCGCKCRFGNCMGNYCSCSANGIECQVEDDGFPCACRKSKCKNPQGRKEYNKAKIREHFLSTIADWIMDQKREQNDVK